jgi:hypothetical protein
MHTHQLLWLTSMVSQIYQTHTHTLTHSHIHVIHTHSNMSTLTAHTVTSSYTGDPSPITLCWPLSLSLSVSKGVTWACLGIMPGLLSTQQCLPDLSTFRRFSVLPSLAPKYGKVFVEWTNKVSSAYHLILHICLWATIVMGQPWVKFNDFHQIYIHPLFS